MRVARPELMADDYLTHARVPITRIRWCADVGGAVGM